MKPRLITAVVLLVVSIGAAIYCVLHINRYAKELAVALETAMACAATESAEWEEATEEVRCLWDKKKEFLHILLPHVNLNELEWTIGSLPIYYEQRDKAMFIEQCVRGLQCVKTVQEMEQPSWGNIF